MRRIIIIVASLFILAACRPSEAQIQAALETSLAQTQAAIPAATQTPTPEPTPTPAPTPTLVPLSKIDLEPILIQPGDLPAGYTGAQVRKMAPEMFEELPPYEAVFYQQFEHEGDVAGGVTVFAFNEPKRLDLAYKKILSGFGEDSRTTTGLGDRASYVSHSTSLLGIDFKFIDLAFSRCSYIAHVRFTDTDNLTEAKSYAVRLQERLDPLLCR